ncbi:MAG TPA: flagellar hook capping FlgD N-terminal domain-containing protein [Acidimicrobiia bacterium]|nr:flagellar hook capping FlgD N-terminal domain-containing protein [Acidimicrobiia bacterium]
MTQVFPISSVTSPTANTPKTATAPNDQLGEDAFLKLLVAQLKYQDPLSPTDSTQFMQQTAQFTMLETLQKIEKEQSALQSASQVLQASTMIGRPVTYSLLQNGQPANPTGTSVVSVRGTLPDNATAGEHFVTNTDIFSRTGVKHALKLDFTKTDTGWSVAASADGHQLGDALDLAFDASGDHTTSDLTIPASALENVAGTTGDWPAAGITLGFGGTNDPTRLSLAPGAATVAVAEQDGNDGNSATGVVTGMHITADGPTLIIGGQSIPLASITGVQS